jgi:hypothetical protein
MVRKYVFERALVWCNTVLEYKQVRSPEQGICKNLERHLARDPNIDRDDVVGFIHNFLLVCFPSWTGYSGDVAYPIGGEIEWVTTTDKWRGESLRLRLDLVRHIRDCAVKALENGI